MFTDWKRMFIRFVHEEVGNQILYFAKVEAIGWDCSVTMGSVAGLETSIGWVMVEKIYFVIIVIRVIRMVGFSLEIEIVTAIIRVVDFSYLA